MQRPAKRRILIDGSMARGGGGFTYLVNILPELSALQPDDQFRVLLRSERLAQSIPSLPNVEVEQLPDAGWPERMRFTYHELPRLLSSWNTDLYFSAGESAPLRAPCPMIASFRNPIIYTDLDLGVSWKQRLRLRLLRQVSRVSARVCDRIMFVSHDSARWMGDTVDVAPHKRAVVHHGIDVDGWARPKQAAGPASHGLSYILSVSSVYTHKNYVRLIEAYAALCRRRDAVPDLVIVGDVQHPHYLAEMHRARAAAGEEFAERIHIIGEVPYAEIKAYYAGADLFVFPSYLESFGHPMLEAMASGAPTVAADMPVFREIGGDAAFYADPYKVDALAGAMEEALFIPRARETLIKRGADRVRQFTWGHTARRLAALFEEVLAERDLAGRAAA
jgi:glycosyltransferase involved in cell wall biosynthesis